MLGGCNHLDSIVFFLDHVVTIGDVQAAQPRVGMQIHHHSVVDLRDIGSRVESLLLLLLPPCCYHCCFHHHPPSGKCLWSWCYYFGWCFSASWSADGSHIVHARTMSWDKKVSKYHPRDLHVQCQVAVGGSLLWSACTALIAWFLPIR